MIGDFRSSSMQPKVLSCGSVVILGPSTSCVVAGCLVGHSVLANALALLC